uniref:Immunoglobulin like and fibronectin type III domain containing 1 n=1 Tax=Cyanistes caeruleus TaxID=156563 RepID=A0A8C0ZIQ5_CYACU
MGGTFVVQEELSRSSCCSAGGNAGGEILSEGQTCQFNAFFLAFLVKIFKKSSIPGVVVTQFVNDVPQGCSTPDFEKKPLTLTLQEGKNAIFRAVVKGVPTPEVKWSRTRKAMDDSAKYEMSFNSATNEFILQIRSVVVDDSDLYRCCAVNAYGEASCSAGLRIIQGRAGSSRGPELKKTLLDSKKLLRKRAAAPKPKPLDKEAVWQLLLHADKRDYEKICMKYGIVDFRGMLRKLQEMRKDTESEQDKLIHSLKNFEHIRVNKEGNATFSLEMELKNSNSNVYLLKDGERLRYGTGDEYRKHCLRRVGRRYYFTVNDVQPEDAGVYQVRVEDVPVFSTELDAQAIPVRFRQPLSDVRCAEAADARFQCVLCTPCHEPLWLHKSHPLQNSAKHQISVTPDGLSHELVVRNVGPSDSGLYTLDAGHGSSSAWLLVEGPFFFLLKLFSPHVHVHFQLQVSLCNTDLLLSLPSPCSVPRCYLNKQLATVRVLKGEPAELSCTVSKDNVTGTWFKDGLKLTSMDGVIFEKKGLVHKLIINKADDIHAGKYRFEGGDVKTEASIFVEDPPQVDKVLLKNLTSVPTVAKAGEAVKLRIPFKGRGPIRAAWLKDRMELGDDTRIRVDKTDTCTTLSISSCSRRDCGDYKVRLKNDSGTLEINLKLVVIDKPQAPAGPIKIVESSVNNITIQWKPPKDDGGKPVQRYLIERQQVGRNDWETLGETPRSCSTFTTSKVEEDVSYYFRVRAMNAEGVSDALESGEVKAAGKASPGAPDPPEIISASRDTITISWKAPCKTGTSQIMGYIVQKRKKGTVTWLPVTKVPVKDKKLKVTSLKKGVQYEFRVAAVNAAGTGQPSDPSEAASTQDPTKSPGQVQDLRVSSSDSTSVTLTWNKPEVQDGNDVKGYEVEMRPCNSSSWTKCFTLPAESTCCRLQGLQAGEKLLLRVTALGTSGHGEPLELEAHAGAAAPVVSPRFLIDDTVKSFLVIKAGNPIQVKIPFEGSPETVVTWLKDGLPLPSRAAVSTKDGSAQLLLRAAEISDSGTYSIELGDRFLGFCATVPYSCDIVPPLADVPQPPGAIQLEENVPNTVTVTWDPSASEQWEKNLYYTVLKRESQKGLWHVLGDLIYNNKFTFTRVVPGRDYYFRVVAKNDLGASDPSETVQPWRIWKKKAEFRVQAQKYRGVNQNQPPRFLVPLKCHVVVTGSECRMSCAVGGHPPPQIKWYKDSRDLSRDPNYFCTNDFGVCSLVVLGVTKQDEGEYMVEASNEMGRAFSKAFLAIKGNSALLLPCWISHCCPGPQTRSPNSSTC